VIVTASMGLALAAAILLPGVARVVEAVGVELDREAMSGPAAIDVEGAGGAVGLGWERQACFAQALQEVGLQAREGDWDAAVQDEAERRCAGGIVAAGKNCLHLRWLDSMAACRLMAEKRQGIHREGAGALHQGGGDRRAGDGAVGDHVAWIDLSDPVGADASELPLGRGCDAGRWRIGFEDGEVEGGGGAAEV